MVQWLRLRASTAWGIGSIPGEEAKIPYAGADQKKGGESEVADSPPPEDGRRRRIQWEKERGAGRRDAAFKRSGKSTYQIHNCPGWIPPEKGSPRERG